MLDKVTKQVMEYILAQTKISKKEYNKNAAKDWYMDADEQIKYGLADEILKDEEDPFKNYGKRVDVSEPTEEKTES